ncbi:MAG: hypothetical protein LR015_14745 [Verrucomicrobia bacterium]|nr:hypothetical protein [Verrucomicrobiota bacterium]
MSKKLTLETALDNLGKALKLAREMTKGWPTSAHAATIAEQENAIAYSRGDALPHDPEAIALCKNRQGNIANALLRNRQFSVVKPAVDTVFDVLTADLEADLSQAKRDDAEVLRLGGIPQRAKAIEQKLSDIRERRENFAFRHSSPEGALSGLVEIPVFH